MQGACWPCCTASIARAAPEPSSHPLTTTTTATPTLPQIRIITAAGDAGLFDYAVISTGLLTDARLRPELASFAQHIATWGDKPGAVPPGGRRNALIDAHPDLGPSFEFREKVRPTGSAETSLHALHTLG